MILTSGDSISIFFRLLPYTTYIIPIASFIIAVVIGGGVSKAGDILLKGIEPYFKKYVFHAASTVQFNLASLGNAAGSYGAFKLAVDAFGK